MNASKNKNEYVKKDYSGLLGTPGFSNQSLETHFALYGGYVENTNKLSQALEDLREKGMTATPEYAELKRRFGWEFNGMRLHDYYFESFGGNGKIEKDSQLYQKISENFGSFEAWREDFAATAKMRGIGWAILYQDQTTGRLFNFWVNEHDAGHPAGLNLILNLDVFEHAYMLDYGKDRAPYIEAFMNSLRWDELEKRLG